MTFFARNLSWLVARPNWLLSNLFWLVGSQRDFCQPKQFGEPEHRAVKKAHHADQDGQAFWSTGWWVGQINQLEQADQTELAKMVKQPSSTKRVGWVDQLTDQVVEQPEQADPVEHSAKVIGKQLNNQLSWPTNQPS